MHHIYKSIPRLLGRSYQIQQLRLQQQLPPDPKYLLHSREPRLIKLEWNSTNPPPSPISKVRYKNQKLRKQTKLNAFAHRLSPFCLLYRRGETMASQHEILQRPSIGLTGSTAWFQFVSCSKRTPENHKRSIVSLYISLFLFSFSPS